MKLTASSALWAAQVVLAASPTSEDCTNLAETLTSYLDPETAVNATSYVPEGANLTIPSTHPTCAGYQSPAPAAFCRVALRTATGPASRVDMEVWLPSSWTGRFLSTGNGGLGGCIDYSNMAHTVARGFAAVGTDNGHTGNTGEPFYQNPGVLEDYAYRAVHTGVVVGKQVVEGFYGRPHDKSYYLGCSTGGRQGFMEAQNFPEDFDGIVAGAPAFAFTGLQSMSGSYARMTGPPGSETFVRPEQWPLVIQDVLDQCDGLDGHVDGVIEDPDLCQYRPERLVCGGGSAEEDEEGSSAGGNNQTRSDGCLTGTQVETVRQLFAPLYDARGELLYPRMQPGGDSSMILWAGRPFDYAIDWWKYVIYDDPSYEGPLTLEDIEAALGSDVDIYGVDAFDPDLSGAKDQGVKILHYHGLEDALITSDNSARYYNLVSRSMELPEEELDEFYRYFRISGMGHCSGGNGAYNVGNDPRGYAGDEAEKNMLTAIVQWVEEGVAPEGFLGTAFADEEKNEVAFQRRHCKYPLRNRYTGQGDPDSADSWECV